MVEINIINDIRWVFNQVGITQFMEMKRETYFLITTEVLCTLRIEHEDRYIPYGIRMQIGGQE